MSDYYLLPLQKRILLERLKFEKDLRRVFKKNIDLTLVVNEEIKIRTCKDDDEKNWVVVQINGETGSKKSSVAISLMKILIDETFTAQRVTQEYNEFLTLLHESDSGQGFILDEMVFQRGTGSQRVREELLNLVETLRKRQNSMIFVTPTEKFIGDDNVTFTLEPCGFDKKTKTVRCLVRKNHRYLGFYYIKLLWKSDIWNDYEVKKDLFLESTKSQRYKKVAYEQMAKEIIEGSSEEEIKNHKRIKLLIEKKGRNMTTEERDMLIEQVKMMLGK